MAGKAPARSRSRLILPGFVLGLLVSYWLLEATMDVLAFHKSSWQEALFSPETNELWMRAFVVGLLVAFFALGSLAQSKREKERREAAEALEQSQARFAVIVDSAMDAIISVNGDMEVAVFNRAAEIMFGWQAGEIVGKRLDRLIPERFRYGHENHIGEFSHTGVTQRIMGEGLPLRGLRRNGEEFPIEASISHSRFHGGDQLTVILRDVTAQKSAERSLRESSARLKEAHELIEAVTRGTEVIMATVDREFRLTFFNESYKDEIRRLTGRTAKLGTNLLELFEDMPEQRRIVEEEWGRVLSGEGANQTLEFGEVGRHRRTYHVLHSPIRTADGEIVGAGEVAYDITERVRAEEALRRSEATLQGILNATKESIWLFDSEGTVLTANSTALSRFGKSEREVIGKRFEDILSPDLADSRRKRLQEAIGSQMPVEFEDQRDGILFHHTFYPIAGSDGKVASVSCYSRDITEMKRGEAQLKETRDYLEKLLNYANAPIIVWEPDFSIARFNHAFERLTGFRSEEVIGKDLSLLFPPETRQESLEMIIRTLQGERWESAEIPIRRKDGALRVALWSSANILGEDAETLVATIAQGQDITERKEVEAALKRSEAKYRLLFQNLSEGFALYELIRNEEGRPIDWRAIEVNDGYERHTGICRSRIVGRLATEVFPEAVPEYLPLFSNVIATQTPTEFDTFARAVNRHLHVVTFPAGPDRFASTIVDVTLLRESQRQVESLARFPLENPHPVLRITKAGVLSYANPASSDLLAQWGCSEGGAVPPDVRRLLSESVEADELREFEVACGARTFSLTFTPRREAAYINVYGRDITVKKAAQEAIKASLREKEILLKEIHHRVKNNLQVISTLLDLQASAQSDPKILSAFRESRARVQAIALVHERLYGAENLSRVDFKGYIGDLVQHLASVYTVPAGPVNLDFHLRDMDIDIDRAAPCGLIINELVANAFEHAFPGGRGGRISVELDKESDGQVRLSVADDGVGFSEGMEAGRFSPIGLQLVSLLAHQLRGTMVVERAAGTRVTLRFPPASKRDRA